jgi:hypothetical protein
MAFMIEKEKKYKNQPFAWKSGSFLINTYLHTQPPFRWKEEKEAKKEASSLHVGGLYP